MKTNSFRVKIALLAGLVSGALLVGAGIVFWNLTYRINLARIDRELRNFGVPQLDRVVGGEHWVRFEAALREISGSNATPAFILWVKNYNQVVHRSPHWPAEVDAETLPALNDYEPPYHAGPGSSPPPPPRRGEEISPRNPALPRKVTHFATLAGGGKTWRLAVMGNPYTTIVIGADINEFNAGMEELRRAYLAALPVVLLLVAAGSWLIAHRALRPVTALTQAVEGITARGLDQRIAAPAHDREFVRLITVFNEMMDRLEKSFRQANRFSADAAHELKTPLAILQGEMEQALHAADVGSDDQRTFSRLIEEIGRLRAITEKLLLLAQADAGKLPVQRVEIDFSQLVADAVEDLGVLAPGLTVEANIAPTVHVLADPHLLPQVIQNLTTNAVKYNCSGGRISVSLNREGKGISLRVSNTGPGIPHGQEAKVFDRFHRVDASRSRELGGVGLGLSLAREIARAHDGELVLENSTEALTTFRLTVPVIRTSFAATLDSHSAIPPSPS